MRRIFIPGRLQENFYIEGPDAHHLSHVMRSKPGDRIVIADNDGHVAECEMTAFSADRIEAKLVRYINQVTESPVEIILAQCLPKGDKLELIAQKATELGVNTLVPLVSDNCVVKYDAKKAQAKRDKWQKVANEAGKQCSRDVLPEVQPVQALKEWLKAAAADDDLAVCMCYENEEQTGMTEFLRSLPVSARRIAAVVGPEGGFSLSEAALAKECGISSVSLGPRILRAETAAIAAIAVIQYEKGDLGGGCVGE